jgi:hypothetical protein
MPSPVSTFIVVAIAGLALPLHARTRKLLSHCGVTVLEIPSRAEALADLRRKVRVDAVVMDARALPASAHEVPEFVALASCGRSSAGEGPMAVVVLGNRSVPGWVRAACDRIGARFFATSPRGPNYRELIRVLRDMCGTASECCTPSGSQSSHESRR